MPDPLTQVQHSWVAMEITPVVVMRRSDGEVIAIQDPDAEAEISMGCERCGTPPDEGWSTLCPGDEEMNDG